MREAAMIVAYEHAEQDPRAFACMVESPPWLSLEVPMPLPSRANLEKSHWARKKLVDQQREATETALLPFRGTAVGDGWCFTVRLTRVSPTLIRDKHDNLGMCLKATADSVARFLGYDDADDHITWLPVKQRKDPQKRPKYQAAVIEIWIGQQECPACQTMVAPRMPVR